MRLCVAGPLMDLPEAWNKAGVYAGFNKVRAFAAPGRASRHQDQGHSPRVRVRLRRVRECCA